MPLSEAAARLLAARSSSRPPPDPDPDANPDAADVDDRADDAGIPTDEEAERRRGFRERAAAEDARFQRATDSEYWFALCFNQPDDPAKFCAKLGLTPDGRYLPGPLLAAALGDLPKPSPQDRARALLAARSTRQQSPAHLLSTKPLPDPLADVEYGGDLQDDTATETRALLTALTTPPATHRHIHDSPHWIVVYFPGREEKDQFLADTGLDVHGDKYLDGHQAASTLQIAM